MVNVPQELEPLLARAFAKVPAQEANEAIARMREDAIPGETALSYEVSLSPERPVAELTEKVAPNLVYFLDCRGAKLPKARGIFVSLFFGDQLYFLHAEDFLVELSKLSGLSFAQMVQRWGAAVQGS